MEVAADFEAFFKAAYTDVISKRLIAAIACVFLAAFWGKFRKFLPKPSAAVLLAAIIFAGFALRTTWTIISPTIFCKNYQDKSTDLSESSLIQIYSSQIAQGGIPLYPEGTLALRRPVGYLYILGFFYKIFGDHQIIFKILQVLMGTALIPMFYFLALRMFRKEETALLVAALSAIYPLNIISVNILLDEFPFFLFSFAAFCLIADNVENKTVRHHVAIGLLLGAAAAARTHAFLFPILFFIVYLFARLPFKKSAIQMITSFALILLVNSPWAVITAHHYGKPRFFTSLQTGWFYCALNDKATWQNGYYATNAEDGGDAEVYNETNPVVAADKANVLSVKWIMNNPVKLIKMGIKRNLVLFGFQLDDSLVDLNQSQTGSKNSFAVRYVHPLRKICSWAYSTLALLAIGGISILIFNRKEFFVKHYPLFILVLLMLGYWFAIHSMIFGFRKYRWFADLMLIFPASYFLTWISSYVNRPAPAKKSVKRK